MPAVIPAAEVMNGKNETFVLFFFVFFRFLIHILNIFLIYTDKIEKIQKLWKKKSVAPLHLPNYLSIFVYYSLFSQLSVDSLKTVV